MATPAPAQAPARRGRGRPPKNPVAAAAAGAPARRGRGRPPKYPVAAAAAGAVAETPVAAEAEAGGEYEREREARIRENMERMQKLGILDLAQAFRQSAAAAAPRGRGRPRGSRRRPVEPGSVGAPSPSRSSLRLKGLEPVSCCELRPKEIYTEEHEKLLGTCNTPWTLPVDGCDKDGKRIYDLVRGQTCHQCQRKTLGHHTSCCKCQIVRGQFCGDCLYTRYGENVLEAKSNPNWICPVCRGICNCSVCRARKGWFPTGAIYRKVISLGYKSVAHYLIATQQGSARPEDSSSAESSSKLLSAKSETSCISEHDSLVAKDGLDDRETSSKAKENKATCRQAKNSDGYNDDRRSESVVTSDSHDDQPSMDPGRVTPSIPTPAKRKCVERNPDCVASRLRPRSNKP